MNTRHSLALLAAAALAITGCTALRGNNTTTITSGGSTINTQTATKATAERSALETRVVANGKVIARQNGIVAFSRAGQVVSKTVQLGDVVRAGQMLAQQDTSDLEFTAKQQWSNYLSALASYSQTIKPTDERDVLQARAAITAAQVSLNNAWASYNNAQVSVKNAQTSVSNAQNSVSSAQANSTSAQAAYTELSKGPSESTIDAALRSWNSAKNSLYSAQVSRDANCGRSVEAVICKTSEASVGSAYENERRAYQAYLDAQLGPTADKLAQSQASVKGAEVSLKNAENGVKTAEAGVSTAQNNLNSAYGSVQSAQINLENAKIKLDALQNPNNSENALSAKARLDQAYASWEAAVNNISKATIYAPHDGVVTTLSFETGDFLGSGTKALEVTAFERPLFEVDVDEADVANIRIGQESRVLLQSYSQSPISATVEYIAPAASVQGNITTVKVRLALGQVGFGGGRNAQAGGAAGQQGQGGGQGQGGPGARNPAIATAIAQGTPAASLFPQGGQGQQAGGGQGQQGGGQGRGPGAGGPGAGGAFTRTAPIPNIIIGMSGTADIIASRIDNALQVPNRALIANRQTRGFGVWRQKEDGTVELVTVTTGTRGANTTQITGGIEAGDIILIPAATATGAGGQQGGFGGGGGGPVVKAPGP